MNTQNTSNELDIDCFQGFGEACVCTAGRAPTHSIKSVKTQAFILQKIYTPSKNNLLEKPGKLTNFVLVESPENSLIACENE